MPIPLDDIETRLRVILDRETVVQEIWSSVRSDLENLLYDVQSARDREYSDRCQGVDSDDAS